MVKVEKMTRLKGAKKIAAHYSRSVPHISQIYHGFRDSPLREAMWEDFGIKCIPLKGRKRKYSQQRKEA